MARRWSRWWIDSSPWGVSTGFIMTHTLCTTGKTELLPCRPAAPLNCVNCQKCDFMTFSWDVHVPELYFNFESIARQTDRPKDRSTNRSKSIDRGSTHEPQRRQTADRRHYLILWMDEWMNKWIRTSHWWIYMDLIGNKAFQSCPWPEIKGKHTHNCCYFPSLKIIYGQFSLNFTCM